MSRLFPLKAKADVRDATSNAWILLSALMISSATPSVKYSFSGSALMLTNGSTAMDLAWLVCGPALAGIAPGGVVTPSEGFKACPNSAAVANRSPGSLASAFITTCSTHSGTLSVRLCRGGGGVGEGLAVPALVRVRVVEGRGDGARDLERLLQRQSLPAVEPLAQ